LRAVSLPNELTFAPDLTRSLLRADQPHLYDGFMLMLPSIVGARPAA